MKKEQIIYRTRTAFGQSENIGNYALASVVNEMAAEGAEEFSISVKLLLPPDVRKEHRYAVEKKMKKACRAHGINIKEIEADVHAGVSQCMAVVTGACLSPKEQEWYRETMRAGQDIVLTQWAGMEGMLRITEEKRDELEKRFAPVFLRQIEGFADKIFAQKEISTAKAEGASYICEVGQGGIYAALWRLAKEAGTGLETDLKKIAVLQETIEVCEHFHVNPYQLASAGSLLIVSDRGEALAEALMHEGTEAAVIGSLKDNNDKIIRNGEDRRYIDRPAPDELNRIFMEDKDYGRH